MRSERIWTHGKVRKSSDIFFCPSDSDKTGSYNYLLNGQNESAIDETATEELLNETASRHFAGMNIAYVDGHVKWKKVAAVVTPLLWVNTIL